MSWQAWEPGDDMPHINKSLVYLGACVIAGLRLAREKQVNVRVVPTSHAIEKSIDMSFELFTRVYRKAARVVREKVD